MTKDKDAEAISNAARVLSSLGSSKGGLARAESLTPEERREIATTAALTRWRVAGGKPIKATHAGTLTIGDKKLACANLPDGRRVISEATMMAALGRVYSGYYSKRDATADPSSAVLPRYLAPVGLKPFISNELVELLQPIPYIPPNGRSVAKGVNAEAVPQICEVWLKARGEGVLSEKQLKTAVQAEILVRGLAHVGIIALVDEATGYQEIRDRIALQAILDKYLRKELAAWAKRFPDEFYQQIFRLRGWQWKGMRVNRPQVVAGYTKDFVYERLAPGILRELESRNPRDDTGNRRAKHHQWLTEDVGHPALAQHLYAVIGFMRVAASWEQFKYMLNRAFPKKGATLELPFPIPDTGIGK